MKTYYTSEKETHMQYESVDRIMDNFFFVETMTEIKVEVKAGREIFLSSSWAVIFGIDHTSVSFLGFTVKDAKANMSRREVRSVCCFSVSQVDPEASNKFKKVFQFSPAGYLIMIKTMYR